MVDPTSETLVATISSSRSANRVVDKEISRMKVMLSVWMNTQPAVAGFA